MPSELNRAPNLVGFGLRLFPGHVRPKPRDACQKEWEPAFRRRQMKIRPDLGIFARETKAVGHHSDDGGFLTIDVDYLSQSGRACAEPVTP